MKYILKHIVLYAYTVVIVVPFVVISFVLGGIDMAFNRTVWGRKFQNWAGGIGHDVHQWAITRPDTSAKHPVFNVIDTTTGEPPDLEQLALKSYPYLMYCDIEGFAIQEDGTLILCDECGKFAYVNLARDNLKVVWTK